MFRTYHATLRTLVFGLLWLEACRTITSLRQRNQLILACAVA